MLPPLGGDFMGRVEDREGDKFAKVFLWEPGVSPYVEGL
jgi:hypothetical protein